jgi:hypothetical protein
MRWSWGAERGAAAPACCGPPGDLTAVTPH